MVNESQSAADREHDRLVSMMPAVEQELKTNFRDVEGISVALKQTQGEFTDELCFRVYVKQKKKELDLSADQIIPKTIRGVKTDVWTIEKIKLLEDSKSYRPLIGGTEVTAGRGGGSGTLGCIAVLTSGSNAGKPVILSNAHVLYASGDDYDSSLTGYRIGQSNYSDCICCNCCGVATNEASSDTSDCAIALLDEDVKYTNEIIEIGLIAGTNTARVHSIANPYIVHKRGRTTELTAGRVTSITTRAVVGGSLQNDSWVGGPQRNDLIEISPNSRFPKFADKGDSGSVLVNSDNEVVGLLYGAVASGLGYAIPIASVLSALNIRIDRSGTAGAIPLYENYSISGIPTAVPTERQIFEKIKNELEAIPLGQEILEQVECHWDEVRKLINSDREVKVAWNRFQGPAFVAHFMKSAKDEDYQVPNQISGISLQNLIIRMAVALQNRGSPELAEAVKANYSQVLQLSQGCSSLPALVDRLKQHSCTLSATAEVMQ